MMYVVNSTALKVCGGAKTSVHQQGLCMLMCVNTLPIVVKSQRRQMEIQAKRQSKTREGTDNERN